MSIEEEVTVTTLQLIENDLESILMALMMLVPPLVTMSGMGERQHEKAMDAVRDMARLHKEQAMRIRKGL